MKTYDFHGKYVSEVEYELPIILLENYNNNQKMIRIITGFGSGLLQKKTLEICTNNKYVENFIFAHPINGGAGAIEITFKKS